jgi:hypothetical protein
VRRQLRRPPFAATAREGLLQHDRHHAAVRHGHPIRRPTLTGEARLAKWRAPSTSSQAPRKFIEMVLLLAACVSVFTTAGIVYILLKESLLSSSAHVPVWDFLTDTQWTPLF